MGQAVEKPLEQSAETPLNKETHSMTDGYFTTSLDQSDPEIYASMTAELERQQTEIELIASENIVSKAVMEAQGSVMTNKYAEGYPGKRYYGGCEHVDVAENLARDRAKQLFNCQFANVQPHSGSQANQEVFFALMQPGDTYLGMSLDCGGHLTHGHPVNVSGKWFNAVQYSVREDNGLIDYDEVEKMALEHQPKLITCGASAYTREIDFARFKEIAQKVGAYFMADIAHYAGLVAGGAYPSPFPHADIVTMTTHKVLRGPRGGMILTNDEELAKKFDKAVFPGYQGGPLMHVIAAKAVAFGEALQPEYKSYAAQVVANAKAMAEVFLANGLDLVSGGTDSHMLLLDLRKKGDDVTGKLTEKSLGQAGLTLNKNQIPYDPKSPFVTSGVRVGTPAGTTRGFQEEEFKQVAQWICDVIDGLAANPEDNAAVEQEVREKVRELALKFPIYPEGAF